MAQQPSVVLLDEPTNSLDLHNQLFILQTVADLAKRHEIAVVMTIHDLNLASMFCGKILMRKDAESFAYGRAQAVLDEAAIRAMYRVGTRGQWRTGTSTCACARRWKRKQNRAKTKRNGPVWVVPFCDAIKYDLHIYFHLDTLLYFSMINQVSPA